MYQLTLHTVLHGQETRTIFHGSALETQIINQGWPMVVVDQRRFFLYASSEGDEAHYDEVTGTVTKL